MAAAGCLVASASAGEETAGREDAPQGVRVLVQPAGPGEGQRVLVIREGDAAQNDPAPAQVAPPPAPPAPRDREAQMQWERARAEWGRLHNVRRADMVKGAYLGVATTPPAPVLRKQLGLPPGTGLVVQFVVPDSPAAQAGLKEFDVLQKLDDQLLINAEQLSVLVRVHSPGEEVKLTIIRDGKPQTLAAKLTEHELEPLGDGGDMMPEDLTRFMPEPRLQEVHPENGIPPFGQTTFPKRNFLTRIVGSFTWAEGGTTYTVNVLANGHRTYMVKDREGSILFDGPVDTQEQRDKVPDNLKKQLEQAQKHFDASYGLDFGKGEAEDAAKPKPAPPAKEQ
jgi:membrane-associated protease RseP (regulator of RpoE activity)